MLEWLFPFPENISAWGGSIDDLFWLTVYLTGFAFLLVMAILCYCLVAYRARPGRQAYYTHGDERAHLVLTVVLAAAVFFGLDMQLEVRSGHYFDSLIEAYPRDGKELRVEVRGEQFAWNFRYAGPDEVFGTEDDVVAPVFRIPVGRPVVVSITSKDVIHSFFLPNLRIKQDAVPGIVTSVWFQAVKEGTYEVACAELCGNGHTRMKTLLKVLSPEAYDRWLLEAYQEDVDEGAEEENWGWAWRARAFSGTEVDLGFNRPPTGRGADESEEQEHHR